MISERKHTFSGHAQGYLCHLINLHAGEEFSRLLSLDPSPVMSSGGYFLLSELGCGLLFQGLGFFFFPRDQEEQKRLLQNRKEVSVKDSLEWC